MSEISADPASAAQPMQFPRYNVQPYTPDRGITGPGVAMLVSALVIVGGVIGYLAHLVSQYFYLIILFPMVIGFVLGWVGSKMVKKGRIRNPLVGGLAGFLGGVLAMFMMHYFDYESFKQSMATSFDAEDIAFVRANPGELEKPADMTHEQFDLLVEAMRVESFPAYMNFEAHAGVQISKATSGSSGGINLGFVGSYIYWIVEVLIVACITFVMVRKQAAEPYCRDCDDWRGVLQLGALDSLALAKQGVESGDVNTLAEATPNPQGSVVLTANHCQSCQGAEPTIDLDARHVSFDKNGKRQETVIARATWPQQALEDLQAIFAIPEPTLAADPAAALEESVPHQS